ncbi:MAG: MarR family winged helix-turn-helix transcriptional regulator [Demequina sp.]|jgi:DNA-binding MarR family transcriptional regulator|nr:MarR family winged helix-turn-helix transcriptional regulator [Demequina sp.]
MGARLANDAWEGVLTAHAVLMRQFAERDVWQGASLREYDVLYTLSKCGEGQRISDLREHVLLSQPALSRLVDRLVEKGLVSRCEDPLDARAVRISLTHAGLDLQRSIGRAHAADVAAAMAALTDEELQDLARLTAKLVSKREQS